MSNASVSPSGSVVWSGKPWITPAAAARTTLVVAVAAIFIWIEYFTGTATDTIASVDIAFWTIAAFAIIWLLSLAGLLLERATNTYTLHTDSLEIRTGIFTSRNFVVVSGGFSDLEVVRGVIGRIIESGDIIVRTQSERDSEKVMHKIRDPLRVADQVRQVLGTQTVRLQQPLMPQK